MPCRSARKKLYPSRDFFCRLYGNDRGPSAIEHALAAFSQGVLRVDFGPMISQHIIDAILGSTFLAGLGQKYNVPIEHDPVSAQ